MDQFTPEELATLRADDRGPMCKQIIIAFTVISFISVCLRLFTRIKFHKTGWEDWTIVVSMMVSVGTAVCQVLQVQAGNGKHVILISYPEGISRIQKYLYFSIITYNVSLTITKVSILMQYHRIFTLREMRFPIYAALVIVISWGIVLLFTSIFSCVPANAYWKVTGQASAKCVNRMALWYTNASVNIVTDLIIAIIPVRGIWGLQIPKRQKTALLLILTIGWFICIVSVLRLYVLIVFSRHQDDATYYSAPNAYWSSIESNLAIVCASLPALKPLVVRIVPVFGTRISSRGRLPSEASGNTHRMQNLTSKTVYVSGGDEEKLTSESSASHTQSLTARSSESEQRERNIYVTKHFSQRVENVGPGDRDSQQGVTAAEFLARGNVS